MSATPLSSHERHLSPLKYECKMYYPLSLLFLQIPILVVQNNSSLLFCTGFPIRLVACQALPSTPGLSGWWHCLWPERENVLIDSDCKEARGECLGDRRRSHSSLK
ncbi:hypothetical protein HN51_044342 [Arachis hypogaea]